MNIKKYEQDYPTVKETILCRRGIPRDEIDKWIEADFSCVSPWTELNYNGLMEKAVKRVCNAIYNKENIYLIQDCDVDGITSSSMFLNYVYKVDNDYAVNNIKYYIHDGKQHGLEDFIEEITIDKLKENNISLIVVPDAGSNDVIQHELLYENGIDCICLDHHEAPIENLEGHAIIVNNQLSDYPNKDMSGAGVVWLFCKAYDEVCGYSYADEFIDICALGNCADMMLITSIETRAIVKEGFANVSNPFFAGILKQNDFSISNAGGVNYMSVAFYVAPYINAVCRVGTKEEKDMLFRAFCLPYAYEKIQSKKRGAFPGQKVELWEEAVRVVGNVKRRQTDYQNDGLKNIEDYIVENNLTDHSVLVCKCEKDDCLPMVRGLIANKLQSKYQRPSLVLTKTVDGDVISYSGSMRNYSMSEIQNFKDLIDESGYVIYATGHQGAAGVSIKESDIDDFVKWMDNKYENISKEPTYTVDFIWNGRKINKPAIFEIGKMTDCWGQGCPEPFVYVKDLELSTCRLALMGKKNDTIKITLSNGVDILLFSSNEDVFNEMKNRDEYLSFVGKCKINEYMDNYTPQILIDEYILENKILF